MANSRLRLATIAVTWMTMTVTAEAVIARAMHAIVPRERIGHAEWLRRYYFDENGRSFNESMVPWVTAPWGPCDAADHPQYRTIWLQWAARTFKTKFGQSTLLRRADVDPCSLMFATRNEDLCKRVIKRYWACAENSPQFRDQVPKHKNRGATNVTFSSCEIIGTWAGSKSGLADASIAVGHGNEIDKWEHPKTATEGDPLGRFLRRGGEFVDALFTLEGTPAKKGKSRVERGRKRSTNHRLEVPCPHCWKFQELVFGDGIEPPGIFWDKGPNGHSDVAIAEKTARYICAYCYGAIEDHHKFEMLKHCIWVPEGCKVDHERAMRARELPQFDTSYLRGTPVRNGRDYGSRLPVWYAPFEGWGTMAVNFLSMKDRFEDRVTWITEHKADTWETEKHEIDWSPLYDRIVRKGTRHRVIPEGFSQVVVTYDRQAADKHDKPIPFLVLATDPDRRRHIVDYGYVESLDESEESVDIAFAEYPHDDEGDPVRVSGAGLDHGFMPKKQVEVCKVLKRGGIIPTLIKTSNTELNTLWKESRLDKKSATPGERLLRIDRYHSQDLVEGCLHIHSQDDPGGLSVFDAPEQDHQDLCVQLLNDAEDERGRWERINRDDPNDYRDCLRYAICLVERLNRGQPPRPRIYKPKPVKRIPKLTMPDGRPYFVGDR